jgi:Chaperone of endosialidase
MKTERQNMNMKPLILIPILIIGLGLLPKAQALSPAPDGGYPGQNTAEGQSALLHLAGGTYNTALGWASLGFNVTGNYNTGVGAATLLNNTASENTATGAGALLSNTTGTANTANGAFALFTNTEGSFNTAIGEQALSNNTTGEGNTAIGASALISNTTGNSNVALGVGAGYFTTGSHNIDIGAFGVAGESETIRIGVEQTKTFIAGIRNVTTGSANAIPVLIDSAGQLGTTSSSRRYKKEIKPMDKTSEAILALKPVMFHYKSDRTNTPQFGLIAEEVAGVNPDLVVRDENGEIYTVRYEAVNAMLLNEFLKEHRKMQQQEATIADLRSAMAQQRKDFETTTAQQQKQFQILTASLKEQAAHLQKVSAQVEVSKRAPQTVVDNR